MSGRRLAFAQALREIVGNHPGQSVAVVSHGGLISTVISAYVDTVRACGLPPAPHHPTLSTAVTR